MTSCMDDSLTPLYYEKTHNQIVGLSHDLIVAVAFVVVEEVASEIPAFIPSDAKYSGLG